MGYIYFDNVNHGYNRWILTQNKFAIGNKSHRLQLVIMTNAHVIGVIHE
jgi:hypothetical protein